MTPQEKGRFCGKCEKTIIDYSHQPDRVIAQAIKDGNGQICGRFRSDQLQRDIVLEPQFYQNTRWKAFGLMLSGLLAAGTLKGQDVIMPSISTEISTSSISNKKNNSTLESKIVLSGRILDEEDKQALTAATIILKGSNIGCATDVDGNFQLEISTEKSHLIKDKLVLEVSYLGYTPKEITITKEALQNNLTINLAEIYLSISTVEMPTIQFFDYGIVKTSLVTGNMEFHKTEITSKEITDISFQDQTLYQWLQKKVRAAREKKAKKKSH
jgi:hypothetical protein